jgi:predicted flap endonuclease-1-like 5' DNA nuclease
VVRHIEFCLEEIECEIDALDRACLVDQDRIEFGDHIAAMRRILAAVASGAPRTSAGLLIEIGDDLSLIRGISLIDRAMLEANGVTRFETIAAWRRTDMQALGGTGLRRRICEQNWIEQAAILATGRTTHFADCVTSARMAAPSPVTDLAAALAATAESGPHLINGRSASPAPPLRNTTPSAIEAADTLSVATPIGEAGLDARHNLLRSASRVAATLLLIAGLGVIGADQFMHDSPLASIAGLIATR